jgi:membrane-bound lytic murein transglycosylase F
VPFFACVRKYLPLKHNKLAYLFLLIATLSLGVAILLLGKLPEQSHRTFISKTTQKNTLKVLLFYHASDYFMYKGTFIGFQYELLQAMEKELKKKVEITVEDDPCTCFYNYFSGKYDIVALDCDPQDVSQYFLTFSYPHSITCPVLVVHKTDTLSYRNIHIPASFDMRMNKQAFTDFAGYNFIYNRKKTAEMLFDELNHKKIHAIITDFNDALMLLAFYPDLKIEKQIKDTLKRRWCLNPANGTLNDTINSWLSEYTQTNKYKSLCNKYLSHNSAIIRQASKAQQGHISPYDKIIKLYAKKYHIDWLFATSIMYQESKFMTDLVGIGGSFGLMQMMPVTGQRYGVNEDSPPEAQIHAGIRHLAELRKKYPNCESKELWCMMAGAYNAGSGHIQDARKLCKKYGEDYTNWNNIAKYLMLLSQNDYYSDPAVRCGYYPGEHTVKYVEEIMKRYEGYKRISGR